jgi:FKBP-type peptidyl-prolyl cis-trans isomerase FkpA
MRALFGSAAALGLAALLLAPAAPFLAGCDSNRPLSCDSDDTYEVVDLTPSGTERGATVQPGQCVSVRYEGRLKADGSVFDGGTFAFVAGGGGTITGFSQGVLVDDDQGEGAQRVGETRRVTIPPDLAYGPNELRGIPACSTLEFDIRVLDILGSSSCGR